MDAAGSGDAAGLNPYVGGSAGLNGGSGGGATPVSAVTASNPQKGVKRGILGNPVGVPKQLPGFRGRVVDPGAAIKAPKLRNGNLNNETSNIRVPYSRVTPLEFLSSFTGRLSPGDVVFVHKYPPGFVSARPQAQNTTLGVNSMSRVVGLDGLNRLLMGSNPEGWKVGMNVMWLNDPVLKAPLAPTAVTGGGNTAEFELSVLNEYRLDGIVISNDEPGTFTSSGARDNALFNIAIQGPTEVNNGFLTYEDEGEGGGGQKLLYNPLTGATNERTVESHARGSAESGQHLTEGNGVPGRVGSPWLGGNKVDFVANFCGTYSTYPSQMFDRRVETMNSLYVGLRAFEMSTAAKRKVVDKAGNLMFASDDAAKEACMVFFQYMPFSSRAAAVIQQVTDAHAKAKPNATEAERDADEPGRAAAAKRVASAVSYRRSALNDVNAPFDTRVFDAIRTDDMRNCVGAWHVGRVLDTKAARHDPYAGGPRDTSFSCMVDVGLSWRSALPYKKELKEVPSDYYEYEEEIDDPENPGKKKKIKRQRSVFGWTTTERGGQQSRKTLTNAAQPCLQSVLGAEFGRKASQEDYCGKGDGGGTQSAGEAEVQEEEPPPPPPAAAVPTPAPAAASAAAAPAAAASTGPRPFGAPQPAASVGARPLGKAPRARSKTPPKGRGAALAAAARPTAAAGMSSTPLVPTGASPIVEAVAAAGAAALAPVQAVMSAAGISGGAAAASSSAAAPCAPRRRAREGGESTTNSVFETMFASSPTAAAPEEPASPTPSSGSDQPAPGPRTFRRMQR